MSILGLDVGAKRVGVAKTDELGMFAHGIAVIEREPHDRFLAALKHIITESTITKIIVGLPLTLSGEAGPAVETITAFIEMLKASVPLPIETWDERLTTKEASRYMHGTALSGSKKKHKIDALAAQIMLQQYLDAQRGLS